MKKHMMVTPETLKKLSLCFSNPEEVEDFISQMDALSAELNFSSQMRERVSPDNASFVLLKQICIFTLFCREHIELIQQLINSVNVKEITEEEAKKLRGYYG